MLDFGKRWAARRPGRLAAAVLVGALALGCGGADAGGTAQAGDDGVAAAGDTTLAADAADDATDDSAAADVLADAAPDATEQPDAPLCSSLATSGEPKGMEPLVAAVSVLDHTGAAVDTAEVKGKWTVLWFYPAAQTAG